MLHFNSVKWSYLSLKGPITLTIKFQKLPRKYFSMYKWKSCNLQTARLSTEHVSWRKFNEKKRKYTASGHLPQKKKKKICLVEWVHPLLWCQKSHTLAAWLCAPVSVHYSMGIQFLPDNVQYKIHRPHAN